jgi:hypothetical protein
VLDTETQRFGMLVRDWEEFAIDVARLVVRIARKDGTKRVHWVDRDWMEPIDFKELKDLDEDAYVLKVYPTNLLPTTPAGRLATVQELMQMEIIADPRQAMALLDFPDLQRFADLQTAAMDSIDKSIELILERGRWVDPVPYMDKQLAQQRVQSALLHGQVHDCPPDRLEMLEEWLEKLLNPDLPALPPPPMPGGPEMMEMAPQGPPMTPGGPVLPPA